MEGRSPNNNADTPPSSPESGQLSSAMPTSSREISTVGDIRYNDISLNVPNVSENSGSNSTAGIGESSSSIDLLGHHGQKRKTLDGSSDKNGASTSTAVQDIPSRSIDSSGPSMSQGQANPRENSSTQEISDIVSPEQGYNYRDGRSRRRQRNVRSSTDSHGTLNASVTEGNRGETSNTIETASNTILQRLRPTARRRELIAQALRTSDNVPIHLENAPVVPVMNLSPPVSLARADHLAPNLPPPQAQNFSVFRTEGINLAVVLNFGIIREDIPQNNLMLNLGEISNEEIHRLQIQTRINTPLSEEAILQGLNTRRYGIQSGEEHEICCICLDELSNGQDLVKLDCGHSYHFDCIRQWLAEKNCCPICKTIALSN